MKFALLAAAALVATPALAQMSPQTTPPAPTQDSTATPPPANAPMTPPTTASGTTTDPSMTPPAPAPAPAMAAPDATPAPMAATGKLPMCRKGQFTGCRERENAKGEGLSKN